MIYVEPSFEPCLLRRKRVCRPRLRELEFAALVCGLVALAIFTAQTVVDDVETARAYQETIISTCEDMVRNQSSV